MAGVHDLYTTFHINERRIAANRVREATSPCILQPGASTAPEPTHASYEDIPMRKSIATTALMATTLSIALAGCYGTFPLVRKAYAFNKNVSSDKFVQEGVFLVMTILPVYGIAAFADAIILNSIEFWTGKTPVATAHTETIDGVTAESTLLPDGSLQLVVTDASGKQATTLLTRETDGVSARSADGEFLGKVAEVSTGTVLISPKAN